ncbi:RNA polymerase sigma factor SigJ [Phytomonospora endophytica]|uniref:RNA polymerase sigma-70 factor (ECF subfamily) n=1 Tax=Phytomonospora endophytica TaxID=714109 RepID=A0A841FTP3_9ACTN|nr:RNA polymerase sigma factor SigJ [Phytomonospora endophytica]MBB6035899.1 RNA polymerase sigma-70 factor (ECF subfamily) [Phytomonospora endophytica]GIG71105.1 RNA polymerase sigma24 factor [Phytomonospora endophytica]
MIEVFEENRAVLRAVAYRMLGSYTEAEDVVQDAWPKWDKASSEKAIENPRAFLVTVVTRLSLDRLRSAAARHERYTGSWLPEPSTEEDPVIAGTGDPGTLAALRDSVSLGMLVLLESLSPLERAAYVLREAFGFGHGEIGEALDRSESTVRQLVRRARAHVTEQRPRFTGDREKQREVTERFMTASLNGDLASLLEILAPDVTVVTDTDGRVKGNLKPIHGGERAARAYAVTAKDIPPGTEVVYRDVNGEFGAVALVGGVPYATFSFDFDDEGRVRNIFCVANPDKLARVRV